MSIEEGGFATSYFCIVSSTSRTEESQLWTILAWKWLTPASFGRKEKRKSDEQSAEAGTLSAAAFDLSVLGKRV